MLNRLNACLTQIKIKYVKTVVWRMNYVKICVFSLDIIHFVRLEQLILLTVPAPNIKDVNHIIKGYLKSSVVFIHLTIIQ